MEHPSFPLLAKERAECLTRSHSTAACEVPRRPLRVHSRPEGARVQRTASKRSRAGALDRAASLVELGAPPLVRGLARWPEAAASRSRLPREGLELDEDALDDGTGGADAGLDAIDRSFEIVRAQRILELDLRVDDDAIRSEVHR